MKAYLPGVEVNRDQEGGSSRVRPFHCTTVGLTPTITPNATLIKLKISTRHKYSLSLQR